MERNSHIDLEKLERINNGQTFEYRDIVSESFPKEQHPDGGAEFKREVENGVYDNVIVSDPGAPHIEYKKI